MPNENILPKELVEAAIALERRLQILNAPSYKVPSAEWEALPANIRSVIPSWIPALLSNYSLVRAALQYENHSRDNTWPVYFSFFVPKTYAIDLVANGYYRSLIDFGFFAFANEADGNVWLASIIDGPSGKIYLLEHSNWDGGPPTKENGLVYAHKSLAHLLSAMAIDNQSFDKNDDCVWGR